MAPASRWSKSERKGFITGTLIVTGVFLVACGAGMSSAPIAGLGVVLAIVGPGFVAVSSLRTGSKELVYGSAEVHEASPLPLTGPVGRCELELVITTRGVKGLPVRVRDPSVPVTKWPEVGDKLPVVVAARDPHQVRILWDRVPEHGLMDFPDEQFPGFEEYPDFDEYSDVTDFSTDAEGVDLSDDVAGYDDFVFPARPFAARGHRHDDLHDDTPTLTDLPPVPAAAGEQEAPIASAAAPAVASPVAPAAPTVTPAAPVVAPARRPSPKPRRPVDSVDSVEAMATLAAEEAAEAVPAAGAEESEADAEPAADLADAGGVSVTLIVSDLDRSRRFYRDVLGLREIDHSETAAVLASGPARVLLRQVSDMPPVNRRLEHLNLDVPDVQEAYERLRAKGVEFVHRPRVVRQGEQLDLCSATFRDPDGHAVALTRWIVRS